MTQENALKIFKSLSDMSRLRIVQSLTQGEMYAELLAERLDLTPSTVSFHMKKLEEAGLVVSRKDQYYTVYSLNREVLDDTLFNVAASEPDKADEQQKREEEYRQKVIDSFFQYGKLRSIPVQRKKKLICYQVIAEAFTSDCTFWLNLVPRLASSAFMVFSVALSASDSLAPERT